MAKDYAFISTVEETRQQVAATCRILGGMACDAAHQVLEEAIQNEKMKEPGILRQVTLPDF